MELELKNVSAAYAAYKKEQAARETKEEELACIYAASILQEIDDLLLNTTKWKDTFSMYFTCSSNRILDKVTQVVKRYFSSSEVECVSPGRYRLAINMKESCKVHDLQDTDKSSFS